MHFPWNRAESDLEREIAHHLYQLMAEYERQGHSHKDALRLAKREFGGSEQAKERCRDERRWPWIGGLRQDIVFGLRMMRRTPVITTAAVISLALAIGASTAIVSLMDAVLWCNLPVPDPQQLTSINWRGHGFPQDLVDSASGSMSEEDGWSVADFFSYSSFQVLRQSLSGKATLAAFHDPDQVSVSFAGQPTVAQERPVSGNFFSTLELQPRLGRLLSDIDDNYAAPATVVLSHRFWLRTLGSPPGVIGRTIIINNRPLVIVGVLQSGFSGLFPGDPTEIYTPLHHVASVQRAEGAKVPPLEDNRFWGVQLIARRTPGFSDAQLRPLMDAAFRSSWPNPPKVAAKAPHIWLDEAKRGLGFLRRDLRDPLLVLGGLVTLLLVIACANIANLLLSRAVARQKEVATRISLGCSRARLMRQFLTESALLAALGGAASIAVAYLTEKLLDQFVAGERTAPIDTKFDIHILLIAAATTAAALLLFGLFPAWRAARLPSAPSLKGGSGIVGYASRHRWDSGRLLTLGQMAMSVVLVMSAVIFTRNLLAIQSTDPGFDRRNLIMFDLRPGTSGYNPSQLQQFYFNLERQLAATPGVAEEGLASIRPMNIGGWWETVRLAGHTEANNANINGVTPTYLSLYTPRLVAGRNIQWTDIASDAKVAVISEDLAAKLGGTSVLGRRFSFSDRPATEKTPEFEIVGIAPAMAATSMKERPYVVWLPFGKESPQATVVLRTSQPPQIVLPAVRRIISGINRNLPMVDIITMEEQISKGLQRERMFATVCSGFGILALVLSIVGLYGVIAYNTSRRRGEIGIRLAIGAMPGDVVSMIVRQGMALAALGILMGLPVIWLGAKYLEKELFQMKPLEPASLLLSLGTLSAAALAAVAIPALRASTIQPAQTLRQE